MQTEIVWRASVDGQPAPELDLHIHLYNGVPGEARTKALLWEWKGLHHDVALHLRRYFDRKHSVSAG